MSEYYDLVPSALWQDSAEEDEAEALEIARMTLGRVAKLAQQQSRPSQKTVVSWRPIGFEMSMPVDGYTYTTSRQIDDPFKPHWLVVSTPGFQLRKLSFGNLMVLEDVDADLYLWTKWDELQSLGQLDRVRLDDGARLDRGHSVHLSVEARPGLVMFKGQERKFRAMLLGEEFTLGPG